MPPTYTPNINLAKPDDEDQYNIAIFNTNTDKIDTAVGNKQNTLQSGVNIKTINGNSLLGSGNISIQTSEGKTKTISLTGAVTGSTTMNTGTTDGVTISTTGKSKTINLTGDITGTATLNTGNTDTVSISTTLVRTPIINIFDLIYPVGSVFLSTTSTCPLASFFGTWQKIGTSIITDISSASTEATTTSVSIHGTGKSLGLTDGTINVGMHGNHTNGLISNTGCFDATVGTSNSASQESLNKVLGVTTDPAKSGLTGSASIPSLTATVTSTKITVNIFKRTA